MPAPETPIALPDKRKRAYAFVIDLTVVACLVQGLAWSYFFFIYQYFKFIPLEWQQDLISQLRPVKIPLLLATFVSYSFFCLYLGRGQTLGKFCFQMRVVDVRNMGQELRLEQALLRSLVHGLCYIFQFFPLLAAYLHPQQRGLSDFLAHTRVVGLDSPGEQVMFERGEDSPQALLPLKRQA